MGRCCKESDVWIKIVPSFPALQCRSILSAGVFFRCPAAASQLYKKQKLQDHVQVSLS